MLENWTSIVSNKILKQDYTSEDLKHAISFYQNAKFKLKKERIALIGCNDGLFDAVRPILYKFAGNFSKGSIADLGNLKNSKSDHNLQLINDLQDAGIIPVIISADATQLNAYLIGSAKNKAKINCSIVDETIPDNPQGSSDERVLFPVSTRPIHWPNQYKVIGIQKHKVATKTIQNAQKNNLNLVRLGKLKSDITSAEPLLRDTNILGLNARALKASETLDKKNSSPSGLNIEQACQIMRYAGINEQMKFANIYGFDDTFAPNDCTA